MKIRCGKIWTRFCHRHLKKDGTKLKIICTCIDSGGHRANQVYKFCKKRFHRNIFAIKGSNDSAAAYIQKPSKNNREQAYLFTIGVDTGKSWLMDRLKVENPGPGYCHFPLEDGKGYDEKYFKGLTSEKKVMRYKMGKAYFAWELKDKGQHKRNEALDCRNYATAAIEITNLLLKKPEEMKQQAAEKRKKEDNEAGEVLSDGRNYAGNSTKTFRRMAGSRTDSDNRAELHNREPGSDKGEFDGNQKRNRLPEQKSDCA